MPRHFQRFVENGSVSGTSPWRISGSASRLARFFLGPSAGQTEASEKGEVLQRGVGTLQFLFHQMHLRNGSLVAWTIQTKKWLLGAGFLGAPPISLNQDSSNTGAVETGCSDLYDVIY